MWARRLTLWEIALPVAAVLLAALLRRILPSESGLTFYFRRSTLYVPATTVGFWFFLAIALFLLIFVLLRK